MAIASFNASDSLLNALGYFWNSLHLEVGYPQPESGSSPCLLNALPRRIKGFGDPDGLESGKSLARRLGVNFVPGSTRQESIRPRFGFGAFWFRSVIEPL